MKLGTHKMLEGRTMKAGILEAKEQGMDCLQIFLGPPQRLWHTREHSEEELADIREAKEGIILIAHAPYVINLCSDDPKRAKQSVGIMKTFMKQADAVGADFVVTHVGSTESGQQERAVNRLAAIAVYLAKQGYNTKLLYENDAGSKGGTRVGSVKNLIKAKELAADAVGICLDTAHAYANGEWDRELIVQSKPDVIHFNDPDPKVEWGGHLDRHNSVVGTGRFDMSEIKAIARLSNGTPCILEAAPEVSMESYKILRIEAMETATIEYIEALRLVFDNEISPTRRGRPCEVCGRSASSTHHVIPLKYWGTNDDENLMMIHMRKDAQCPGHFAANAESYAWVRSHKQLFGQVDIVEMAKLCKEAIIPKLRLWVDQPGYSWLRKDGDEIIEERKEEADSTR